MVEISSDTQGRSRRCSQSMLRSGGTSTERSGRQAVLQITHFTQPPIVSLFWWDSSSRAATLAGKQACLRLSNRQHTHNLKQRINQLPPLPNLTLSQKLNKYKVNATTYTRGNHCLACNISQSGQLRSCICGSLQQSSCQLPSIRYYQRTPKNFTSSYQQKKRGNNFKTNFSITEATSYQSIAKECKIGQHSRNHLEANKINHVEMLAGFRRGPDPTWRSLL